MIVVCVFCVFDCECRCVLIRISAMQVRVEVFCMRKCLPMRVKYASHIFHDNSLLVVKTDSEKNHVCVNAFVICSE